MARAQRRTFAEQGLRPAFRSMVFFDRPDGQCLAVVALDRDCEAFDHLVGQEVAIDEALYHCENVHPYSSRPYMKGESVGLIVKRL